jgi:hypothetical protein
VIVAEGVKLLDEPLYEVDADRRDLARMSGGEKLSPAPGHAVEHGDAQMREMRPRGDLSWPDGRGDELGSDDKSVPAMPVTNEVRESRERGGALAGSERRDHEGGIVLVKECRRPLLVLAQNTCNRRRAVGSDSDAVHDVPLAIALS